MSTSKIYVIYSEQYLYHDTHGDVECKERIIVIRDGLLSNKISNKLIWLEPYNNLKDITEKMIAWNIHDKKYIKYVKKYCKKGGGKIEKDLWVSSDSYETALLSVGGWIKGVQKILETKNNISFVLARPPGHHAGYDYTLGMCIFANASIAANYAIHEKKIDKVAIIDIDVHHGDGTELAVKNNNKILFCSLHQELFTAGTKKYKMPSKSYGNIINIGIPKKSNYQIYKTHFEQTIVPIFKKFKPKLLIVSLGLDAAEKDPLANINLKPTDYGKMSKYFRQISNKIVLGLEGGYHLESLRDGIISTLSNI